MLKIYEKVTHRIHPDVEDSSMSADEARKKVYDALAHQHPVEAIEALDHLTTQDIIWRLTAVNDIHEVFSEQIPTTVDTALKNQITEDAYELARRCFSEGDLTTLGLGGPRDTSTYPRTHPSMVEVHLLGKSWDNTGDSKTCELLARSLAYLDEYDADIVGDALEVAMTTSLSFQQAFATVGSRIDRRLDRDWNDAYQRVKQQRVNA